MNLKRQKWFFWLMLGVFSSVFAELPSASCPYIFTDLWGLLVVIPLYSLHTLVLAPLIIRPGKKINFAALYAAGVVFGLYEAYITKVLWNPPWAEDAFKVGGLAFTSTLVLVFFWHVFFAFILPLAAADKQLNKTSMPRILPKREKLFFLLIMGAAALLHGASIGTLQGSLSSTIPTSLVLLLLIFLWEKFFKVDALDLAALLPRGKAWRVFFLLLILMYILMGIFINPDRYPGVVGHISIWVLYAVFLAIMFLAADKQENLVESEALEDTQPMEAQRSNLKPAAIAALIFIIISAISGSFFSTLFEIFMLVTWVIAIGVGMTSLLRTVRNVFWKK